jgi:hypothetical protein
MQGERFLEDRKFVEGLGSTRAGRIFQAHVGSVCAYNEGRAHDSSIQEAITNERVLVTAIARCLSNDRPMPCGLPSPLPKFVAICNLSGERLILHGSSPSLLRRLCTRSSALPPREVAQALLVFEAYPSLVSKDVEKFVLISYSMPWQAGVGSAYWSVSCCDYTVEDRIIRDRMMHFTCRSNVPFNAKSVRDPTNTHVKLHENKQLPIVSTKQINDMINSFCCCDLDLGANDVDTISIQAPPSTGTGDKRLAQLEQLVEALKLGRAKDNDEIKRLKGESVNAEHDMVKLVEQCEVRVQTVKDDARGAMEEQALKFDAIKSKSQELLQLKDSQYGAVNAELNALKTSYEEKVAENTESTKALKKLRSKTEELRRQSAAKDQLGNAASSKHKMTIKVLEDGLDTAKGELLTLRQDLEQKHKRAMEEKAATQFKELERSQASILSKERIVNQLSEVSERREAEIQSLQAVDALRSTEIEEQGRVVSQLKAELDKVRQELDKVPKVSTKASSTRTSSTSTHSCATTQTPPPRPATPPPPPPKPVADVDVTTDTAATTTVDSGASLNADARALCENAETAVHKLIAYLNSIPGHEPYQVAAITPQSYQPQFVNPNVVYAPPPTAIPQFFQMPPQIHMQHPFFQSQQQPQPQPQLQNALFFNGGGGDRSFKRSTVNNSARRQQFGS